MTGRRHLLVAGVFVLAIVGVLALGTAPVGAFDSGEPDMEAFLSQPTVSPGEESEIAIDIVNTGRMNTRGGEIVDSVTEARGVRVDFEDEDVPLTVTTGEMGLGDMPSGAKETVNPEVRVPDDTPAGEYDIEVEIRYRYTLTTSAAANAFSSTETHDLTVVVDEDARFAIIDTETDTQVGGTGDLDMTVENVGTETAHNASLAPSAVGEDVTVGTDAEDTTEYLGTVEPGSRVNATFDSAIEDGFGGTAYVLESTVEYDDADGIAQETSPSRTGVTPVPAQQLAIASVIGDLEVGYGGAIRAELENDGPRSLTDAVVEIEPRSDRIHVEERHVAIPDTDPGETAALHFEADVSGQADPGTRQVTFTTEFESGDGTITDDHQARVGVAPREPEFDIDIEDRTIPRGEDRELTVTITNNRPETLSSINANLYADDPLTAIADDAFVDELDPGESATIRFQVGAGADALETTYPVEFDFRYDDARGDDRISDIMQEPITVTPSEDTDTPLLPILVLFLLIGLGLYVLNRRGYLPDSRAELESMVGDRFGWGGNDDGQ